MADQRARIEIVDDGNAVALEIFLGSFAGAPIRGEVGEIADNESFNIRLWGFFVIGVGADVADVRVGEANDLPGVTWIGENFLIAGETGVENNFAATAGESARRAAVKDAPVLEREYRAACGNFGQRTLLERSFRRRIHG